MSKGMKFNPNTKIEDMVNELGKKGIIEIEAENYIAVSELGDAIKTHYLSIMVWLIKQNGLLNKEKYAEIHLLMTRIRCSAAVREEVRLLLFSEGLMEIEQILYNLRESLSYLQQRGLKFSIVKDAIWIIQNDTNYSDVKQNVYFKKLLTSLNVDDEQLNFIIDVCENDKKIMSGEIEDGVIKKTLTDLAAKSAAAGVPIATVYLSGSVVGLSAAGMTSGLAALGFGGLIGLSSMATGIGTAIVLGVVTYQGIKYLSGSNERDKISIREFMLAEILLNHQRSISDFAEDIALIANELKEALVDIEKNKQIIAKIIKHIVLTKSAINHIQNQENYYKDEIRKEQENR